VDAGPVRRAYPETFTHATAIGPIIELQLALSRLHHDQGSNQGVTPGTLVPLTAIDC
jgi:hypothetical protein